MKIMKKYKFYNNYKNLLILAGTITDGILKIGWYWPKHIDTADIWLDTKHITFFVLVTILIQEILNVPASMVQNLKH